MILKVVSVSVLLLSVFIGLLASGVLSKLGLFRFVSSMRPTMTGLIPSTLTDEFRASAFSFNDIPDLTGHVSLVTGANIGLGFYSSLHLARHGSTVIMACRSKDKCDAAAEDIKANTTAGQVITMTLDTSSIQSVDNFAKEFTKRFPRLDHTIFNAGIGPSPKGFQLSVDGYELLFATNHLGHFRLFNAISPLIESTAKSQGIATIVHVSSALHYDAKAKYGGTGVYNSKEELNNATAYNGDDMYATTKFFNVLFSNEVADRMKAKKVNVLSNSVHPGLVNTNFATERVEQIKALPSIIASLAQAVIELVRTAMWTSEEGALTQVFASVSRDVVGKLVTGKYFHPIGILMEPHALATKENQLKLWAFSEECVNKAIGKKNLSGKLRSYFGKTRHTMKWNPIPGLTSILIMTSSTVMRSLYRSLMRLATIHDHVPSYKFILWQSVLDIRAMEGTVMESKKDKQVATWLKDFTGSQYNFYKPEKCMRDYIRRCFRENGHVDIDVRLDAAFACLRLLNKNVVLGKAGGIISSEIEDIQRESNGRRLDIAADPSQGCLLLAYPQLRAWQDSQIFSLSTVLVTDCDDEGGRVKGLIVNYPLFWKFVDVRESLYLPKETSVFDSNSVFRGGPVNTTTFSFLHPHGKLLSTSKEVLPNVYLDNDWLGAAKLVEAGQANVADFVVYSGHAEWEPLQLTNECNKGMWFVVKGQDADNIVYNKMQDLEHVQFLKEKIESVIPLSSIPLHMRAKYKMWRYVLKSLGGELRSIANQAWSTGFVYDYLAKKQHK